MSDISDVCTKFCILSLSPASLTFTRWGVGNRCYCANWSFMVTFITQWTMPTDEYILTNK